MNDLYILELKPANFNNALAWEYPSATGTPPSPRESHTANVYVSQEESGGTPYLIIYGGMSGCRLGDLWTLNLGELIIDLVRYDTISGGNSFVRQSF